jgi:LacI family transcriptional regulator
MALATLEVALSAGLSVPQDLSIISFDNTPLAHFTRPPLTAIDQPIAETTSKAVELIIAAQKGAPSPRAPTVIPSRLVERESVAAPPVEACG